MSDKEILKKVLKILEHTIIELQVIVKEINDDQNPSSEAYKVTIKKKETHGH